MHVSAEEELEQCARETRIIEDTHALLVLKTKRSPMELAIRECGADPKHIELARCVGNAP